MTDPEKPVEPGESSRLTEWQDELFGIYLKKKADWWNQQATPKFPFNYCPHCGNKLSLDTFTKEIHNTTK